MVLPPSFDRRTKEFSPVITGSCGSTILISAMCRAPRKEFLHDTPQKCDDHSRIRCTKGRHVVIRKRLVVSLVVLAALGGVLGYQAYQNYEERKQAALQRQRGEEMVRQVQAE